MTRSCWAGVDVGGRRKGFDVAILAERKQLDSLVNLKTAHEVAHLLAATRPEIVAIDSPSRPAEDGQRARDCERLLAHAVCGIRWTPGEAQLLAGNQYYDWIVRGLELYRVLEEDRARGAWTVIEVFPTASWTVWAGKRGARSRAAWTREALAALGIMGLPTRRLNQDDRDAIAAALTARLHGQRKTRSFGEIIVPTAGP